MDKETIQKIVDEALKELLGKAGWKKYSDESIKRANYLLNNILEAQNKVKEINKELSQLV